MIKGIPSPYQQALQGVSAKSAERPGDAARVKGENSFDALLNQKIEERGVRFSRHAVERMAGRNIRVGPEELSKINEAVDRAAEKGAKESLFVLDRHAFIVSVENRTVITVMDRESMRDNLFTNIDSAMVL